MGPSADFPPPASGASTGDRNCYPARVHGQRYPSRHLRLANEYQRVLGRRRAVPRLLIRLPVLFLFSCGARPLPVSLSDSPPGRFISEHLACRRRFGVPRYQLAQGVLEIPSDFPTYMRGRPRHALRTNLHRADEAGYRCRSDDVPEWSAFDRGLRSITPAEYWEAVDSSGATVAWAWLVVDTECALLYALMSSASDARWLLHTAIVERLSSAGCPLLLARGEDVPLLGVGQQHFQHLLGYTMARLRPRVVSVPT